MNYKAKRWQFGLVDLMCYEAIACIGVFLALHTSVGWAFCVVCASLIAVRVALSKARAEQRAKQRSATNTND